MQDLRITMIKVNRNTATGTISTVLQQDKQKYKYTASIYKVYRKGTALQATGIACFQYKYILRI